MSDLLPILPLGKAVRSAAPSGRVGQLRMIPISDLRVDDTYQRAVSEGSVRNIERICAAFDWSKFIPVIVVEEGGVFPVVDGQHRSIAAATIGIKEVPCYVLSCSAPEAAAAFAAINGNVTPISAVDIWFASLAAQDPQALRLKAVLDAGGVKITRKKDGHKVGETRSVKVLYRALEKYGDDLLITILQCVTETGEGNPGLLVGSVINAIGSAIRTKRKLLANPTALFEQFDRIDIPALFDGARIESARTGNPPQFILSREINLRLSESRL